MTIVGTDDLLKQKTRTHQNITHVKEGAEKTVKRSPTPMTVEKMSSDKINVILLRKILVSDCRPHW